MKTTIEDRLRTHLNESADRFSMDPSPPKRVVRRAHRRAIRTGAAATVALVAATSLAVVAMRGESIPVPGHRTGTGSASFRLVDYADDSDGSDLRAYAQCMRDQGYDFPDPVKTDQGWSLMVPPGSIDRTSPRWQEAAFVTCNLAKFAPRPLSGDLVMGFDAPTIDRFVACMHAQGFDLEPTPAPDAEGNYRWRLQGLGIDTRSDRWYRALMITCSPTDD